MQDRMDCPMMKINDKKGFVLLETFVVMAVLCVVLIMLYAAYSKILIDVKSRSLFDNTEYLFKTTLIRKYLESELDESLYNSVDLYNYCSNRTAKSCYTSLGDTFEENLFRSLKVEAIYITVWDSISTTSLHRLEATTQNYIKSLDVRHEEAFRLVVMYESENNDTDLKVYEYASLRFGSRG